MPQIIVIRNARTQRLFCNDFYSPEDESVEQNVNITSPIDQSSHVNRDG